MQDYLSILFEPDEHICFGSQFDTKILPQSEISLSAEYIAINPFREGTRRNQLNVSAFRNFLIELDQMELDLQRSYIDGLQMPYSTIVYSGGKSLHFIISLVDPCTDLEEYKSISTRLRLAVKQADRKVKDPGRFSRLPGHIREDTNKEQKLLYCGARIPKQTLISWLDERRAHLPPPAYKFETDLPAGMRGIVHIRTHLFLKQGAPEGEWNNSLFNAACDCSRNNYTEEEFIQMAQRITGHLDASDLTTIRSAYLTANSKQG